MYPEWQSEKGSNSSHSKQNPSNDHSTPKKNIISCLYIIGLLIYVAVMATLLSYSWNLLQLHKQTDEFYYANQVAFEWKKGFITDIIVTTDADCPSEYEHAFEYKWPGTSFGCYCQPSENITFVLEGYCTPSLIQLNCRNMESKEKIETHYWENSSNICVQRSEVSMLTEEKYDENKHKICGSSNGLVIMPNSENCPFVNVTFTEPTLQTYKTTIQDGSILMNPLYGIYNATSPYSFYNYPISGFKVSEYQFCLISEDSGLSPDHYDFILLNIERGCAESGNASEIDSMTEKQFYENNPKLQQLTSIEGFPPPSHWEYKFGFTPMGSWTYPCRHNMDGKFAISKTRDMFNLTFEAVYTTFSTVIAVFIGVIGIQFFILTIRKIFHYEVYPTGYKQMYLPQDFCKALLRYIFDFSCKLTILGLVFYLTWVAWTNWNWFKSAVKENCSDGHMQINDYILNPYTELYLTVLQFGVGKVIVCLLYLIVDIIHFVFVYRNDLKFYLVSPEGKELVGEKESARELDFDNLNWLKKETDKKERIMEIDDVDRENNDFRVTMAFYQNEDDNQNKKPQIKRTKKPRGFLFKKNEDKDESVVNESIPQRSIYQDENPFMLDEAAFTMFKEPGNEKDETGFKKDRKRR